MIGNNNSNNNNIYVVVVVVVVLTPQIFLLLFSISSSPCWEREGVGRECAISSVVFSCLLWWTSSLERERHKSMKFSLRFVHFLTDTLVTAYPQNSASYSILQPSESSKEMFLCLCSRWVIFFMLKNVFSPASSPKYLALIQQEGSVTLRHGVWNKVKWVCNKQILLQRTKIWIIP